MAPPAKQKFAFRGDSTFTVEQSKFIILKWGELKCLASVRRAFASKFHAKSPRKVPHKMAFKRVIDRFEASASVRPMVPAGLPPLSPDSIAQVRDFFSRNPKAHIRQAVAELGMSFGQVWRAST